MEISELLEVLEMHPQVLSAIISALIAGAVSIIVSSFVAVWIHGKKLRLEYNAALLTTRLAEYRRLWELTEPTGWHGDREITRESSKALLTDLDRWYFKNGAGLVLSKQSMSVFVRLLKALSEFDENKEKIRELGEQLRSGLMHDIGGRKPPLLRGSPRHS